MQERLQETLIIEKRRQFPEVQKEDYYCKLFKVVNMAK